MPFKIEMYFTKEKTSNFEVYDVIVGREQFFFCFVLSYNYKTSNDKFLILLLITSIFLLYNSVTGLLLGGGIWVRRKIRKCCEKGEIFHSLLSNALFKFKDCRFVPATESEKLFQKRLQEILKQNDFSV